MPFFRQPPTDKVVSWLGRSSAVTAALFLLVHVLTLLPDPPPLGWSFSLYAALVIPYVAMILFFVDRVHRRMGPSVGWSAWKENMRARTELSKEIRKLTPRPLELLFLAVAVYAAINFGTFVSVGDESFVWFVRLSSGHGLLFSVVPAVYLLSVEPKLRVKESKHEYQAYN